MDFLITSKAGAVMGVYEGETQAEALAAMHRDAGIDVTVDADDQLVYADESDREIAGGLEAWYITDVEDEGEYLAKDVDVEVTLRPEIEGRVKMGHTVTPARSMIDNIRFELDHSHLDEGPAGDTLRMHVDDRDGEQEVVERALQLASAWWHERLDRALRDGDHKTAADMLGL